MFLLFSPFFYMCMYLRVYKYVSGGTCVCVYARGGQRSTGVISQELSTEVVCDKVSHWDLGLADYVRLAGQ